jgi:hypothetical protein
MLRRRGPLDSRMSNQISPVLIREFADFAERRDGDQRVASSRSLSITFLHFATIAVGNNVSYGIGLDIRYKNM